MKMTTAGKINMAAKMKMNMNEEKDESVYADDDGNGNEYGYENDSWSQARFSVACAIVRHLRIEYSSSAGRSLASVSAELLTRPPMAFVNNLSASHGE